MSNDQQTEPESSAALPVAVVARPDNSTGFLDAAYRRSPRWFFVALFAVGLAIYAAFAGGRITKPSSAPHFTLQAEAWLSGHIALQGKPIGDDWARIETVSLDDGSTVRGRRMQTRPAFRLVGGGELELSRLRSTQGFEYHMSFPPFPAIVMLPQTLIAGRGANDTLTTVLLAALTLPLAFALLRRMRKAELSQRSVKDDLWLVALLCFGTVLFFSSVQGKVWFTAHVIGVVLALIYALASVEARNPIVAGLALGFAATTRTPMAFMFPWFILEAWRVSGGLVAWRSDRSAMLVALRGKLLRFALPVIAIAAIAASYNYVRFGSLTEFGHSFLDVRQQQQIERWGLFSYHYLSRNLAVLFTLLPELPGKAPWIQIGGHGLALWVTTPAFVLLLWPAIRHDQAESSSLPRSASRSLWLTVALVAIPTLFYQNSGWWQFGYRFSLDYTVFLVMLLAIGGRPMTRWLKGLIIVGIIVNAFGALTFDRSYEYYRLGGDAYDVVMKH